MHILLHAVQMVVLHFPAGDGILLSTALTADDAYAFLGQEPVDSSSTFLWLILLPRFDILFESGSMYILFSVVFSPTLRAPIFLFPGEDDEG